MTFLTPPTIFETTSFIGASAVETAVLIAVNFSTIASFTDVNFSAILPFIPFAASPIADSFSPIASLMPVNFSPILAFTPLNALTHLSTTGFNAPSLYEFFTKSKAFENALPNASFTPDSFSLTVFTIGASLVFTLSTTCPSLPPVNLFNASYPVL